MSHKEDWLNIKFNFDSPTSDYHKFMDFLRETPKKVESLVNGLPAEVLTRRDGDSWSIQENVGHFLTVESLFLGRMEDYQKNAEVLRPARFEDNPTDKEQFNRKDLRWILDQFREQRAIYMAILDDLQTEEFGKTSWHPRLEKPMRICDMLQFHSAHDQHHLARIQELKMKWGIK